MPAYYNSAYEEEIRFYDADTGSALDVSAYDFGMKWYRPSPSHKSPVTLTPGSGIDVTDAATGIIVVSLTPSQVNEIGVGSVRVELFKNYSNSTTKTIIAEGTESIEGSRYDA